METTEVQFRFEILFVVDGDGGMIRRSGVRGGKEIKADSWGQGREREGKWRGKGLIENRLAWYMGADQVNRNTGEVMVRSYVVI